MVHQKHVTNAYGVWKLKKNNSLDTRKSLMQISKYIKNWYSTKHVSNTIKMGYREIRRITSAPICLIPRALRCVMIKMQKESTTWFRKNHLLIMKWVWKTEIYGTKPDKTISKWNWNQNGYLKGYWNCGVYHREIVINDVQETSPLSRRAMSSGKANLTTISCTTWNKKN